MSSILESTIESFRSGIELNADSAESCLDALINERNEDLLTEVFIAWHQKGITGNEIYEIARVMRSRMIRVNSRHTAFVDIVGTGGSKAKTFNVSTAAAFVVAGAGIPVAKHGNKAATSNAGSSDVLSELGIEAAADPITSESNLNEYGICFMFAPSHHRLSQTLAKVRRGLGFPTIFNCVGPLCNPANAPHQLIGVWDEKLIDPMADALQKLGTVRSWIVHGENGIDEISLSHKTFVAEVDAVSVKRFEITSDDLWISNVGYDFETPGSAVESAEIINTILAGASSNSPHEGIVLLNATAAMMLTGQFADERAAFRAARQALGNDAIAKMELLKRK